MPRTKKDRDDIFYRVDGEGEGLVLVHGTGGDGDANWNLMVERLARRRKVVRPDYSGSNQTRDAGGPLTVDRLAAQVLAAAEAADATPFDLVGLSLGAAVAVHLAATHPDKVRSLVLIAGFADANDSRQKLQFRLWRDLIDRDRETLSRLILLTGFSPSYVSTIGQDALEQNVTAMVSGNNWEGMRRQVDLDLVADVREEAKRIAAPTLVVGCVHDHLVPSSNARQLKQLIAGARYAELDSGHLVSTEKPGELCELIEEFIIGADGR